MNTTRPAHAEADPLMAARQTCYLFFARSLSDPASGRWKALRDPAFQLAAAAAADFLIEAAVRTGPADPAPGEGPVTDLRLDAALRHLDPPGAAEAGHRKLFGFLLAKDCPPYETEYCPQTFTVYRSHQMADIAGFYRAFGLEPSRDCPERVDHISLELEFVAWLIGKTRIADGPEADVRRAVCRDAQERFVADHLSWWVPAFCDALRKKARKTASAFHGAVADALAAYIAWERGFLGVPVPMELTPPNPASVEPEMSCAGCDFAGAV